MTARMTKRKCNWCGNWIEDTVGPDWPWRLGNNMVFCCEECKTEKNESMNRKRSAAMTGRKLTKKKESEQMNEDEYVETKEQETETPDTAEEDAPVEAVRQEPTPYDREEHEIASLRMDHEIDRRVIAELEAKLARLERRNATLVRMIRDGMSLLE